MGVLHMHIYTYENIEYDFMRTFHENLILTLFQLQLMLIDESVIFVLRDVETYMQKSLEIPLQCNTNCIYSV